MEAIVVKNVSKSFKHFKGKSNTLKDKLILKKKGSSFQKKVLNDISFSISAGESVGLVGKNGSGKSTTLKLISKIIYPDNGTIEINGRVSSLLELGAGFHPDMTGRENIYTNASIFGLSKALIDSRVDEIIKFSELGEFVDEPVRTYSSGMYMRLAFSVAINVDADVILIDEILAVGDANFQAKCFNKLVEMRNVGKTIVIVSHDLASIERICTRSIWIEGGEIRSQGNPVEVHAEYLSWMANKDNSQELDYENEKNSIDKPNRHGNEKALIDNVTIKNLKGEEISSIITGQSIKIEIDYKRLDSNLKCSVFGIAFYRNDELCCYGTNTFIDKVGVVALNSSGKITLEIDSFDLLEGTYYLDVAMHDEQGIPYDYIRKIKALNVISNFKDVGVFRLNHKWIL